jgi:hypothetical protein
MSKQNKEDIEKVTDTAAAANEKKPAGGFGKKIKYGSMSAAVMVLVIAIVIVANLICGMLMKRYPVKIDLTPDKRYDLSDETIGVLKDLDKDIEITVTKSKDSFSSWSAQYKNMFYQYYGQNVDMPYEIIPEILDKYSVYAEAGKGSITVKYVDVNKDPDVVARFSKNYSGEITADNMVFSCGDRVKVLSQSDLLGMITPSKTSTQTNIQMTFAGEQLITSNIVSVTDAKPVRVAMAVTLNGNTIFDTTHSAIASSLSDFLIRSGYDCTDVDIATDALSPDDYDMLVLCAPGVDFSDDIISKFSDFLYNNGNYEKNMIYVASATATNLPKISEFLEDWKIEITDEQIYDDTNNVMLSSNLACPALQVGDKDSVGTLPTEKLPIIAPFARKINVLSKNNESIVKEVLKTYDGSYLVKDNEKGDTGSFDVAAISRKETSSGINICGSNLLVISSPFMFDDSILSNTNTYNNANVFTNVINQMSGKENGVIVPAKTFQQNNIAIDQKGARVIEIVVIIVIPALIAVAGVTVLLRRKNK